MVVGGRLVLDPGIVNVFSNTSCEFQSSETLGARVLEEVRHTSLHPTLNRFSNIDVLHIPINYPV